MGFLIMTISMLLGIFFIAFGISRTKSKRWHITFIVPGIVFVLSAIYLALPK